MSPTMKNRPYSVEGVVAHGDKRGRLLGFPTVNLPGENLPLRDGVWAGTVTLVAETGDSVHVAAISLGRRPTYYSADGERLVEAFLLDFDRQIYGELVRVQFHECLRGQQSFADSADLVEQLHQDVTAVREWATLEGLYSNLAAGKR